MRWVSKQTHMNLYYVTDDTLKGYDGSPRCIAGELEYDTAVELANSPIIERLARRQHYAMQVLYDFLANNELRCPFCSWIYLAARGHAGDCPLYELARYPEWEDAVRNLPDIQRTQHD